MKPVKAKKHLGQHFLRDENIAQKIAETLLPASPKRVLEIGPGMGVLTKYLLKIYPQVWVAEIDRDSIEYLNAAFPDLSPRILDQDFLKMDISSVFGANELCLTGNYPYNISSQIVFKALKNRHQIPMITGMFQKEVAQRICEPPGSKDYGILSVLAQAFYTAEYLFTVPPGVFNPPPKVQSGVIRLTRKNLYTLPCDESLFFSVVKTAFNQRRKTLKNALKPLIGHLDDLKELQALLSLRAERLSVDDFVKITQFISSAK